MIIYNPVNLKELFEKGREYPWRKPSRCPNCGGNRLWGHGFVGAYFDDFDDCQFLKRCRCPDCGCVLRFRPRGYLKRFHASTETIRKAIHSKINLKVPLENICRCRQQHWVKALKRHVKAWFGDEYALLSGFDMLLARGIVPVTRGI